MDKIWLIIKREYLTRVRKKSFIIMSILGPLLIAAFYGVVIWAAINTGDEKTVQVVDESGIFAGKLDGGHKVSFVFANAPLAQAKADLRKEGYDAVLFIPKFDIDDPKGFELYSSKGLSSITEAGIRKSIEKEIEQIRLRRAGIDQAVLDKVKVSISLGTMIEDENGDTKDSSTIASTLVGTVVGLIIYMFIFLYGVQVMRGVIEEKTNRIVEVIISSVKPFQLMMGKVLGIAGVGLTQLLIWIVLSVAVSTAAAMFIGPDQLSEVQNANSVGISPEIVAQAQQQQPDELVKTMKALNTLNIPLLTGAFLFYFLFGYLMYAALFGAIGSAVDNETDSQQFMLPVTLPLIMSIAMTGAIIADPYGPMGVILSIFPLTSPVVMMIRLPFIGFSWELVVSMVVLVLSFLGTTWLAGRIYRIGILMYGKKPSYKELGKWIFYKG